MQKIQMIFLNILPKYHATKFAFIYSKLLLWVLIQYQITDDIQMW